MDKYQVLEKQIERTLGLIERLRVQNHDLSEEIRMLKSDREKAVRYKDENIAWQKDRDMIKLRIEKILAHIDQIKWDEEG